MRGTVNVWDAPERDDGRIVFSIRRKFSQCRMNLSDKVEMELHQIHCRWKLGVAPR